ncbi:DUF5988 family protein [Actinomadura sp. 6K520]|jgi:hypothetical protein|uniref:DUF5988 family protein n=1 Tax=Actinomadura sp. 6K520 TaxID=2530364 RepID=UPI00104544C7|nr:DUF5988 family protein [Actinomadura sp. 6K520]TDE32609.1 hypothetical protein E1289_14955 [Actinomadura sp. 6K520]
MDGTDRLTSPGETVEAVLIGGPADIPQVARTVRTPVAETKIKILHHNGYEHFEIVREPRIDPSRPVAFHWTMRTKIAE